MSDLDQYGTARSDDGTGGFDAGSARPHRLLYRLEILWIETGALFEREMEAGRGFIWLPVLFGIGVVIYFALPAEPSAPVLVAVTVILGFSVWRIRNRVALLRVLMALTTLGAGLTVTKLRTDAVAAPILAHEMTVNLSGWIAEREAAARGGVRIVLLVDGMDRVAPVDRPQKVRVTVRSKPETLAVGDAVDILARLRPPNGPAFPGGYDFARADFYRGVGAVGFAYGAAKPSDLGPAPVGIRLAMPVSHLRRGIRDRILAALPGVNGQIASALVMGDRRGIPEATQEAMRASGLGHVLAISGLHMALVAGSAYWLIRALLALSPTFAIRFPIRKWAAGAAMTIAAFYLTISGAGVSTQRAFIMLAVMLMAVMIDRRALTLRNVAIAAMIILV
ncbi:MAG: ComEC/Rec2 family competence protein, partial [Hyphomicrobiales bacterium]|nr:ComEC/Rec2 family competence protein [Hyphomicrobiales bacterium]